MSGMFDADATPPPPGYAEWREMYRRAERLGWTFKQATYQFFTRYGYWPADDMPLVPPRKAMIDWARRVGDVPLERLNPDPWGDEAN